MRSKEELLADIDATFDQLIRNATAISHISLQTLAQHEVDALQKTQESLLARLLYRNQLLGTIDTEQMEKLSDKVSTFQKLNRRFMKDLAARFGSKRSKKWQARRSKVRY